MHKISIKLFALIFTAFLSANIIAQQEQDDYKQIDQVISKLYTSISFINGKEQDYITLKKIHHEKAMIGSISTKQARIFPVKEFRSKNKETFKKNNILSFQEKEIDYKTLVYGGVATRFSTYEFEIKTKDRELKVIGVNVFQLIKDPEKGWLILSNVFSDNMSYPNPKTHIKIIRKE
ncbi:hypothetical protein [Winogradskyella haliclonae]|uniref:Nuclear transport factor 2 family protein n=1 Tax=Winogradskyella haliclonae TaxID=2048558 RepID=A0ABQ2C0L3_9FLAO|nr:hypothetical protein [Winogradskyella haliclonae]GGI57607.1 hypothetical protein GCM10011444_19160 [Winogradskyella haliclonae]